MRRRHSRRWNHESPRLPGSAYGRPRRQPGDVAGFALRAHRHATLPRVLLAAVEHDVLRTAGSRSPIAERRGLLELGRRMLALGVRTAAAHRRAPAGTSACPRDSGCRLAGIRSRAAGRQRARYRTRSPRRCRSPWPSPPTPAAVAEPAKLARSAARQQPPRTHPRLLPQRSDAGDSTSPAEQVAASAPARPARRLTVPVLLLIVGVSLVGVAAVFFLVFAWFVADIGMRALIIGGVTLATMVVASLLPLALAHRDRRGDRGAGRDPARARRLGGARERPLRRGRHSIRSSTQASPPRSSASSAACGPCSPGCAVPTSPRPSPSPSASVSSSPGSLPLETSGAITAGLLGHGGGRSRARTAEHRGRLRAPASGLRARADGARRHRRRRARRKRRDARLRSGVDDRCSWWVPAGWSRSDSLHALLLRDRPEVEAPARFEGARCHGGSCRRDSHGIARMADGCAERPAGLRGSHCTGHRRRGRCCARSMASACPCAPRRTNRRRGRRCREHRRARASAALFAARSSRRQIWILWETPVFAVPLGFDPATIFAAIAAAVTAVLLFFAPTLDRPGARDARPIVAAFIVVVGALGTGIPIVVEFMAIALAACAILALARGASRGGWGTAAAIAALTAFTAGLAAPWLWAVGVLVAVAVPIAARAVLRPKANAAVLLALAPVLVAAVAAFIAPWAVGAAFTAGVDPTAALIILQWVSVGVLVCAVALPLDAASRSALAISAQALVVVSLLALTAPPVEEASVSAVLGEPVVGVIRTAVLLALLALVALRRTRIDDAPAGVPAASLGAAALIAPVAACTAIAVIDSIRVTGGWAELAAVCAAAAVVWLGALIPARAFAVPFRALARRFADGGALATAVIAGAWAPADFRWAVLAVIAIGFAGASVTRGWAGVTTLPGVPETQAMGVAAAQAPRRLLAWPAWAAAAPALWLWLDGAGSFEIETFVLPPADRPSGVRRGAGVAAAAGRGDGRGSPVLRPRARGARHRRNVRFADARHRSGDRRGRTGACPRVHAHPPGADPRTRRRGRRPRRARNRRHRPSRSTRRRRSAGCSSSSAWRMRRRTASSAPPRSASPPCRRA